MDALPNQEALNKALNIYRASMRSFIIFHLKQIPGMNVEDVVIDSVGDWRADEIYHSLIESGRDIESMIDINDFPHLVNRNWEEVFERSLNDDKTFRNQLWLIVECRNATWAHPPKGDAESESTRVHLFLIADLLGKIKRLDKKREVEIIRDNLFVDDTAERLAATEERLKEVEAENAEYKRLLSATLEKKGDPAKRSTQDSGRGPEHKSPQKPSKTGKIEELLTSLTASVEQKTQAKPSKTEKSEAANTLKDRVEIGRKVVTEADIDTIATEIRKFASNLPSPESLVNSNPPAVRVIDCVLSLNRPYKTFVVPRLKAFMSNRPEIQQVSELANLMDNYPAPHAFVQQELNYNHENRARVLHEVVTFLVTIVQQTPTIPEEEALKKWVAQAQSQIDRLDINGFGPAGFQYLCMLFGVDTTKPDIYIIRFVSGLLNRNVSDLEAHALLEAACERVGVSVRAVDNLIWNRGEQRSKSR